MESHKCSVQASKGKRREGKGTKKKCNNYKVVTSIYILIILYMNDLNIPVKKWPKLSE